MVFAVFKKVVVIIIMVVSHENELSNFFSPCHDFHYYSYFVCAKRMSELIKILNPEFRLKVAKPVIFLCFLRLFNLSFQGSWIVEIISLIST